MAPTHRTSSARITGRAAPAVRHLLVAAAIDGAALAAHIHAVARVVLVIGWLVADHLWHRRRR